MRRLSRGAPKGSRNAAKGDEPRTGRIAQRVPPSIQLRWEEAAKAAGKTVADLLIERAPRSPTIRPPESP